LASPRFGGPASLSALTAQHSGSGPSCVAALPPSCLGAQGGRAAKAGELGMQALQQHPVRPAPGQTWRRKHGGVMMLMVMLVPRSPVPWGGCGGGEARRCGVQGAGRVLTLWPGPPCVCQFPGCPPAPSSAPLPCARAQAWVPPAGRAQEGTATQPATASLCCGVWWMPLLWFGGCRSMAHHTVPDAPASHAGQLCVTQITHSEYTQGSTWHHTVRCRTTRSPRPLQHAVHDGQGWPGPCGKPKPPYSLSETTVCTTCIHCYENGFGRPYCWALLAVDEVT